MSRNQTVEQLDLSGVNTFDIATFVGRYEDGRTLRLSVEFLGRFGDYVYGFAAAKEQPTSDRRRRVTTVGLRSHIARLPVDVIEPGTLTIELAAESCISFDEGRLREGFEAATWHILPGEFEKLEFAKVTA